MSLLFVVGYARQSCAAKLHPGLASWGILSRPSGTSLGGNVDPGLTSWATFSRPSGLIAISKTIGQQYICLGPKVEQ